MNRRSAPPELGRPKTDKGVPRPPQPDPPSTLPSSLPPAPSCPPTDDDAPSPGEEHHCESETSDDDEDEPDPEDEAVQDTFILLLFLIDIVRELLLETFTLEHHEAKAWINFPNPPVDNFFPSAQNPEDRRLRASQMYGIAWMEHQVNSGLGAGIVADEVGLGKVPYPYPLLSLHYWVVVGEPFA